MKVIFALSIILLSGAAVVNSQVHFGPYRQVSKFPFQKRFYLLRNSRKTSNLISQKKLINDFRINIKISLRKHCNAHRWLSAFHFMFICTSSTQ